LFTHCLTELTLGHFAAGVFPLSCSTIKIKCFAVSQHAVILRELVPGGRSLVDGEGLQGHEGHHGVAQRLAEGTQVLAVLQVDDQLGVEAVPGRVLDGLEVPEGTGSEAQ
jgi:hypothetical protein